MCQRRYSEDGDYSPVMYTHEDEDVVETVSLLNCLLEKMFCFSDDYKTDYIKWRVPQLDENDGKSPSAESEMAFTEDWWTKKFKTLPQEYQEFIGVFSVYDLITSGDLPQKFIYKEIEPMEFFKARKRFSNEQR